MAPEWLESCFCMIGSNEEDKNERSVSVTSPANKIPAQNGKKTGQGAGLALTLWDTAFEKFKADAKNNHLVEKYYEILVAESGIPSDLRLETRKVQLDRVIEAGCRKQEKEEIKCGFGSFEYSVTEGAEKLVDFVLFLKEFVGNAVKASPEASLAWAGVCLLIPILTVPKTAKAANAAGFAKVTLRMQYYVELEKLLLSESQLDGKPNDVLETQSEQRTAVVLGTFKTNLLRLYEHIIEFQVKCAVRYHECRSERILHDYFQGEDWSGMVKTIEHIEQDLTTRLSTMTEQRMRQDLQSISNEIEAVRIKATETCKIQVDMLNNVKDIRDFLREITQNTKPPLIIPLVAEVLWNSNANRLAGIEECCEGTRIRLKERITIWANDPDAKTVLWLHGSAGVGKSTVAYTMAKEFQKPNCRQLAATYFFRRGQTKRNNVSQFFPSLCTQLVQTIPEYGKFLEESLKSPGSSGLTKDTIKDMSPKTQFVRLLQSPLKKISSTAADAAATIIVIDALDECEASKRKDRERDIKMICRLLLELQKVDSIRLRFLITSTAEDIIAEELRGEQVDSINLQEVLVKETKEDVTKYLCAGLENIRKTKCFQGTWPEPQDVNRLIVSATHPYPLFIYVSTLLDFLAGERSYLPRVRLQRWLNTKSTESHLSQVYKPILDEVAEAMTDYGEDNTWAYNIMFALVGLTTPLSVGDMSLLLNIDPDCIATMVRALHSVLVVPDDPNLPVEIFNNSFRDFCCEDEADMGFVGGRVEPRDAHRMLLSKCLEYIKNAAKEMDAESPLSRVVDYACTSWLNHLRYCGKTVATADGVRDFLENGVFKWISIMAHMGKLSLAMQMLNELDTLESTLPYELKKDAGNAIQDAQDAVRIAFTIDVLPIAMKVMEDYAHNAHHEQLKQLRMLHNYIFYHNLMIKRVAKLLEWNVLTPEALLGYFKNLDPAKDQVKLLFLGYLRPIGFCVHLACYFLQVDSLGRPKTSLLSQNGTVDLRRYSRLLRHFAYDARVETLSLHSNFLSLLLELRMIQRVQMAEMADTLMEDTEKVLEILVVLDDGTEPRTVFHGDIEFNIMGITMHFGFTKQGLAEEWRGGETLQSEREALE